MNRSADPVAEVPPGVVTVMSTVPAEPAGAVAEIWVAELTVAAAGAAPKATVELPATKPVPVTVTTVDPPVPPPVGTMPVTVGALS